MTRDLVVLVFCLMTHAGTTARHAQPIIRSASKVEVDNQQVRVLRR